VAKPNTPLSDFHDFALEKDAKPLYYFKQLPEKQLKAQ